MIHVSTDCFLDEPGLDTGISHAIVRAVGTNRLPNVFRIHRTPRIVAFGRQDRASRGYGAAVAAAGGAGYAPVERLAGGRAAVFHEDTLAFSWAMRTPNPRLEITHRFERVSGLLRGALADLGFDAQVGELPGEYCPGAYSIHIGGRAKVTGVGQRLVPGAAHVGGVLVVDGGMRIAEVLLGVYAALEIPWDPRTSGDLADFGATVSSEAVVDAVLERLEAEDDLAFDPLPGWVVDEGRALAPSHVASTVRTP